MPASFIYKGLTESQLFVLSETGRFPALKEPCLIFFKKPLDKSVFFSYIQPLSLNLIFSVSFCETGENEISYCYIIGLGTEVYPLRGNPALVIFSRAQCLLTSTGEEESFVPAFVIIGGQEFYLYGGEGISCPPAIMYGGRTGVYALRGSNDTPVVRLAIFGRAQDLTSTGEKCLCCPPGTYRQVQGFTSTGKKKSCYLPWTYRQAQGSTSAGENRRSPVACLLHKLK